MGRKEDLNSEIEEFLGLQEKDQNTISKVDNQKKKIRNKILRGGTTGDKTTDLLIFVFGKIPADQELEVKIRNLEIEIKKHPNEQILVIIMQETVTGCTGFGSSGHWGLDVKKYLGTIKEPFISFDYEKGLFTIETTEYVVGDRYRYGKELFNNSISLCLHVLLDLDKEIPSRDRIDFSGDLSDPQGSLNVIIGDKDVEMFHQLGDSYLFSEWKKKNISTNDALDLGEGRDYVDASYIKALEILGKKVTEVLQKKYDKMVQKEQEEIIDELEILRQRSGPLRDIGINLKKAIELNMHKADLIIEEIPVVQIIVKKYIIEMCKKHKVNIPK